MLIHRSTSMLCAIPLFLGLAVASLGCSEKKSKTDLLDKGWSAVLAKPAHHLLVVPDEALVLNEQTYSLLTRNPSQALLTGKKSLRFLEEKFGNEDKRLIIPLRLLCDPEVTANAEKVAHFKKLIELRDKYNGENSAETLFDLNSFYGDYAEFAPYQSYTFFLKLADESTGTTTDRTALVYSCLALNAAITQKKQEARNFLRKAAAITDSWTTSESTPDATTYVRSLILLRLATAANLIKEDADPFFSKSNKFRESLAHMAWKRQAIDGYTWQIFIDLENGETTRCSSAIDEARAFVKRLPSHQRIGIGMLYQNIISAYMKWNQIDKAGVALSEFERWASCGNDDDRFRFAITKCEQSLRFKDTVRAGTALKEAQALLCSPRLTQPQVFKQQIEKLTRELSHTSLMTSKEKRIGLLEHKLVVNKPDNEAAEWIHHEMSVNVVFSNGRVNAEAAKEQQRIYQRYRRLLPNGSYYQTGCKLLYITAKALQELDLKHYDQALDYFSECLSSFPPSYLTGKLEYEDWICYTYCLAGRMDEARKQYRVMSAMEKESARGSHCAWYRKRYPEIATDR